jgi:hypothetical protein
MQAVVFESFNLDKSEDKLMIATNQSRQHLVAELIEHSAQIDRLVAISRTASADGSVNHNHNQDLEALRARQREITQQLHASEESGSNSWENIGGGG